MLDQRGQLLRAAVGLAGCSMPSYDRALHALRSWLDSWSGIGLVTVGMARQGYDLQLTRYDEKGWRVTFYTAGMEHSPTSATGTGWERTPWRATQRAAWEALRSSGHRRGRVRWPLGLAARSARAAVGARSGGGWGPFVPDTGRVRPLPGVTELCATVCLPAPWPYGLAPPGAETPVNLAHVRGLLLTREATMDQESLRILIQRKIRDGRLPRDGIKKVRSSRSDGEMCDGCDAILSRTRC